MEIVVPDEFKYLYVQNKERPVVKVPAAVLRQTARKVRKIGPKTDNLIDELTRVMRLANGVGIAAPQLGELERIIVIAPAGMKLLPLINPEVVFSEGEFVGQEGCLSIPGLYGDVLRALKVKVEAYDRKGRPIQLEMEGLASRVVQHEIDHLNGRLFTDLVDETTLHWAHPEEIADQPE